MPHTTWKRKIAFRKVMSAASSMLEGVNVPDTLLAIRPCHESKTGWTAGPKWSPQNHSSLALNERGPALKVFWSRPGRDGRKAGERARWPRPARVIKERLTKKTEPEGARTGSLQSAPFGSKVGNWDFISQPMR